MSDGGGGRERIATAIQTETPGRPFRRTRGIRAAVCARAEICVLLLPSQITSNAVRKMEQNGGVRQCNKSIFLAEFN